MLTGYPVSTCDTSQRLYCDQPFNGQPTNGVCRRYPLDGQPCNQFSLPQCDPDPTLALRCNQFSGTAGGPATKGDAVRRPGHPALPRRSRLSPTAERRHRRVRRHPRAGEPCVDRCVSPAVCAGPLRHARDTAARGAVRLQHRLRVALVHRFPAGPTGLFTHRQILSPLRGRRRHAGVSSGFGGQGGFAGSFITGFGGHRRPTRQAPEAVTAHGGTAGARRQPARHGRLQSNIAPRDPVIADFGVAMGSVPILPIGGTFTYASPGPRRSTRPGERCLAHHRETTGTVTDPVLGRRHLLQRRPDGHGLHRRDGPYRRRSSTSAARIEGAGCTAQYATNDSAHTNNHVDPKGSGDPASYAPQAPLVVSPTVTTVRCRSPASARRPAATPRSGSTRRRLTGVQWQFTTPAGTANSCTVDITIDNVRFF